MGNYESKSAEDLLQCFVGENMLGENDTEEYWQKLFLSLNTIQSKIFSPKLCEELCKINTKTF